MDFGVPWLPKQHMPLSAVDYSLWVFYARLRRERGIHGNIPVLLSTERPRCQLVSLVEGDQVNLLDYQVRGGSVQGRGGGAMK